jgi:hypothetical protein
MLFHVDFWRGILLSALEHYWNPLNCIEVY